jgi:hypothetical protein
VRKNNPPLPASGKRKLRLRQPYATLSSRYAGGEEK